MFNAVLYQSRFEKNQTERFFHLEFRLANYLLDSIDKEVQPCENFYQFACGTWLKNNRIPDDGKTMFRKGFCDVFRLSASSQDTFNVLRTQLDNNVVGPFFIDFRIRIRFVLFLDILTSPLPNDMKHIRAILNARTLYDSCVNESAIETAGTETVLNVLENELGGWPILRGNAWNSNRFNFSNLLIRLREYNNNIIYSCGTATDDKNSSAYYIRVSQIRSTHFDRRDFSSSSDRTKRFGSRTTTILSQ